MMKIAVPAVFFVLLVSVFAIDSHLQRSLEPRFKAVKNQISKRRCLQGYPVVLIQIGSLPDSDRAIGDPCVTDSQCDSNQCSCMDDGSKQCSSSGCQIDDTHFIKIGEHYSDCDKTCDCDESGPACVDTCPPTVIDCQAGFQAVEIPPEAGQCCTTQACECVIDETHTIKIGEHYEDCQKKCDCTDDGLACVDTCAAQSSSCPQGMEQQGETPPASGECCSTPICVAADSADGSTGESFLGVLEEEEDHSRRKHHKKSKKHQTPK